MNPQDDPEARIRDLERPLSEVASASEMGTAQPGPSAAQPGPSAAQPGPSAAQPGPTAAQPGPSAVQPGPFAAQPNPYAAQPNPYTAPPGAYSPPPGAYSPPPTVPPVGQGGTYPPAAPMKTAGLRGCWIVLAVLVVLVIALGAAAVIYGAHLFSSVSSTVKSASRPSPSRANPFGTGTPGNPANGGSTATAPAGGTLEVSGVGQNKTIACNDAAVTITGATNTIVLTGHCTTVTVMGTKNVVTLDTADTIAAEGLDNQVTFHSGSPSVENEGTNTVGQG